MDTNYKIPSSKLEDLSIMNSQCCVNLTASKSGSPTKRVGNLNHRKIVKQCKLMILIEILITIAILSFVGFLIYVSVESGYLSSFYETENVYDINQPHTLAEQASTLEPRNEDSNFDLNKYFFSDLLLKLSPDLRSVIVHMDQNRLRRQAKNVPCTENMEHCKTVIDSMWSIVSIVNNSLPHLQSFLNNFSTDQNGPKSKFVELVECLQCKNDSIASVDESGSVNDDRMAYEHIDHAQIKNNVEIVNNLLNDKKHNKEQKSSTNPNSSTIGNEEITEKPIFSNTDDRSVINNYNNNKMENSINDNSSDHQRHSTMTQKPEMENSTTIRSMELTSSSTEAAMINATASGSITRNTEEASAQMSRINGTKWDVVTATVTAKPDADNVTEITKDPVHPLVHPSGQGQGERTEKEESASNKTSFRNSQPRIASKVNPDALPTAETMKSSQQLQLNPTMSWTPYQVCFYAPGANGLTRQSAPGQMYPGSSMGSVYPVSMPQQHRQGFQSPNQVPSYTQVQVQNMQFLPGGQPGQKMGPTGPATQNFPAYSGHQISSPTAAANLNSKSTYYCTYIPAPTFQFPTIPGVTEYQRSSAPVEETDEVENIIEDASRNKSETCPFNMIRCDDGSQCILRSQWCNGLVDCTDASDETSCSCRDRISQDRLCDGYFDCPHGEDELGCLGCPKTKFSCNDWQRRYTAENCVPMSKRCDGIKHCANGRDEMECNILTSSHIEGKNVFIIGHTDGYLHKNFKGQWYPVCMAVESWAKDACASEIGKEITETPTMTVHPVPSDAYKGSYITEMNGETKIIPSCRHTAIYVRCPQFPCGISAQKNEDFAPPQVFENEEQNVVDGLMWPTFEDKMDPRVSKLDSMVGSQLRVVGGRASQPKAWPFLVAIYKDGLFYCGGVILNELWILTAAHCLYGYTDNYFEVQAGILRKSSFSPMAQTRKARYIVPHPQYNSKDMINDIAMIMLDDPLHFNRWVRPVCLPGRSLLGSMWRFKPEPNSICVTMGWGALSEHGPDPDDLREVQVPILSSCRHLVDQIDATICAGYPQGGRDACQGDSGGPLMCRNPYSKSQWYVAGVVSHGEGCAQPNEPGVYTRVSYFLDWIQDIINGRGLPSMRRTPLEKCPGFRCGGGLGICLPITARCNRTVDCLDGEDEVNCPDHYPLYRSKTKSNFELKTTLDSKIDYSTVSDVTRLEISSTIPSLISEKADVTTDKSTYVDDNKRVSESDQSVISTTVSADYAKSNTVSLPTVPSTTFTCSRLLQTISANKRCDRIIDCEDSTDEMNCTCKDFLKTAKPSAICDDYVDCEDLTDEQDCEICAKDEFFCKTSKTCIPMSKKCNGVFDCPFREDDLDCFTLTDDQHVYLDANKRPFLNMQGILTQQSKESWQTTCHRPRFYQNESTLKLIGQNMCEYFGFRNMISSMSVLVKKSKLETIAWPSNSTYQENSTAVSLNKTDETCPGISIQCASVLGNSVNTYLVVDAKTGSRDYLWPWAAAIFVDGHYRCSALLLEPSWVLSAAKCLENVRLDTNYTTAVFGYGPLLHLIDGPHQQQSVIDELHLVNGSVSILLHLKNPVEFTRHVQPLFLNKTIYLPGLDETCVALATDENYETKSIFMRPVLQSCATCQRCFVNASDCSGTETSNWSGTIFCRGKKGWRPTAVFQDNKGMCNLQNPQAMTSIDYINPYLIEAIDAPRRSVEATCNGFRCKMGQCIPPKQICNGVSDCRDKEDENPVYCAQYRNNCEDTTGCSCKVTEIRCKNGKCVDKSAFCDGKIDCSDGSDEPETCSCAEYLKLTIPERLCDGVRHCFDKTDESPDLCPCKDSSFQCRTMSGNDTCIPQDFVCDGIKDCLDGEDEATCRITKKVSVERNEVEEVIRRSYGVWHSECFPNPVLSNNEASELCKSMGYSSGSVYNDTVVVDEPMIPRRHDFHMVRLNSWLWMTLREDGPLITLEKSNETCHRAFVDCV
ncbi:serine protease nudel-like isoform X2 [Ceratina calcarata]|uniref:Serine protease nudel-like isoform X2 n=1 Tax=Ceratina calcarata TaxID=156304 RepID=A0AAJ7RVP2_9HYME|nr:serine protease nudel-like isoform X2 [Ceratina calcarata]